MMDVLWVFPLSASVPRRLFKILPSHPEDYFSQKNYKINLGELPEIKSRGGFSVYWQKELLLETRTVKCIFFSKTALQKKKKSQNCQLQ